MTASRRLGKMRGMRTNVSGLNPNAISGPLARLPLANIEFSMFATLFDFIVGWVVTGIAINSGRTARNTAIMAEIASLTEAQKIELQAERAKRAESLKGQNRFLLIVLAVLIGALWALGAITAHAQEICDFEHQCYHGDLAHPDQVTPPPAPQYPPRGAPTPSQEPLCRLFTIREAPQLPARIVEICALSPDQELSIRQRTAQPPVTMIDPPWGR
jgi:hypothetical protein